MMSSSFPMKTLVLGLCPFALSALGPAARAEEPSRRVELKVGDQQSFRVPGLKKVSPPAKVADVRATGPDGFILFGLAPGRGNLLLFLASGKTQTWDVQVLQDLAARARDECRQALGTDGCAGLTFSAADDSLVLAGEVRDLEAYHRYRKVRALFPDARSLVAVEPTVLDGLLRAINQTLTEDGVKTARLHRVGRRLFLEGTVEDEAERQRIGAVVQAMLDLALGPDGEVVGTP
jgi:hypothetical protein